MACLYRQDVYACSLNIIFFCNTSIDANTTCAKIIHTIHYDIMYLYALCISSFAFFLDPYTYTEYYYISIYVFLHLGIKGCIVLRATHTPYLILILVLSYYVRKKTQCSKQAKILSLLFIVKWIIILHF